jgi:hypothetical protein
MFVKGFMEQDTEEEGPGEPESHTAQSFSGLEQVPLGTDIYVCDESYVIDARDRHSLVDEDMNPVADDSWWCLTLRDSVTGALAQLSCEKDDEDRWQFWFMRELSDVSDVPALEGVSFDGEDGAPPLELEYDGQLWRAAQGDHDYTVHVYSERTDRADPSEYLAQVTEYKSTDPAARRNGRTLCLELWDGGMTAAVGSIYRDNVLLL